MHRLRVEEIAQSPDMKNVIYNGKQVYIQQVNENNTARIFPLDDPQQEMEVQLTNLYEQQ
ncbi:H-type small acid-soluble spore protein [Ornithinibacillus halotolerans]|uniref:Small, acid-soluble spore protein H n=1 Tax=Ornithinibacillus halotolerans TaxID=1274357 RepID=A0A916S8Z3_9BACI|nr:H-type small acid-soluble spore protein [Ornithinibacillus halotolerans]GGA89519.1 small, acid-soluble spore protein H [Ornithinibacillus halotolerans]